VQEENPEKYQEAWAALKEVDGTGPTHTITQPLSSGSCTFSPTPFPAAQRALYPKESLSHFRAHFHLTLRVVMLSALEATFISPFVVYSFLLWLLKLS
jgi:hypothetical protein